MAGASGRNKPTEKTKRVTPGRERRAKKQPQATAPAVSPGAINEKQFLSTNEVAALLGIKPHSLRRKRSGGRSDSPPFVRLGNSLFSRCAYRVSDLEEWLAQRTTPSAPPAAARARGR
jgi:predicted DNA-binding transcriptional regulator AlpA